MTQEFARQIYEGDGKTIYFPNSSLFPDGLRIDNVMFTIPGLGLEIYWYGFLIALGMVLAIIYAYKNVRRFGLEPDRFTDTVLAGFVGAIIGARAYYVIFSLDKYLTEEGTFDLMAALRIRDGGLAIYGGVIGALLFGVLMAKIRRVRVAPLLDLAGMGFLIGQCIGRWGNFFNQEAFGSKTTLPWGMTSKTIITELLPFYGLNYTAQRATDMIAHPCFLYESLWCLVGFLALHFYKKHRKFDGELFLLYIGWYGLGRFWIEGLRTDSLYLINNDTLKLKVSQLIAGACVIFAVITLIYMYISVKKNGRSFYKDSEESIELLRIYDERLVQSKRKSGKHANDKLDEHILVSEEDSPEDSDSGDIVVPDEADSSKDEGDGTVSDGEASSSESTSESCGDDDNDGSCDEPDKTDRDENVTD